MVKHLLQDNKLRDEDEIDPQEREADRYEHNYARMDGDIGLRPTGAGPGPAAPRAQTRRRERARKRKSESGMLLRIQKSESGMCSTKKIIITI